MLVLGLDTASAAVSVALADVTGDAGDGPGARRTVDVRAERTVAAARGHGELLTPTIDAVMSEAGARPTELTAIVAGTGPGPYTGLRVGLVTATALADALGIPVYGVCSLDGLAAPDVEAGLIAVTDARRKEVYWARYDGSGGRVDGPHVDRPEAVPQDGVVTGAGARMYPAVFATVRGADHPSPAMLIGRSARRVLGAAPSELLEPLYLRHPDAVEPGTPKAVRQ